MKRDKISNNNFKDNSDILSFINEQFEECMKSLTEEGLKYLALQGGYYKTKEPKKDFENLSIPFYLYEREEHTPGIGLIQEELNEFLLNKSFYCTNFSLPWDYKIESGKMDLSARFMNKEAIVNIRYPLTLKKGEEKVFLKDFNLVVNTNFLIYYNKINEIIKIHKDNQGFVPLGELELNSKLNNYTYSIFYDNKDYLYIITFDDFDKNETINYNFFIRYNSENEK